MTLEKKQTIRTQYPSSMHYVRSDKDLLLYNVFYHNELDTLFVCYKNVKTGEQIMDEIVEPLIPVYITNRKMSKMEQIVPIKDCTQHFIRYNRRYRSDDLKSLLYDYKEIQYTNAYGEKVYKRLYPDIPKKGYALNPNLYGYGETIEQIILKEYALQRFETHDGFTSEVIPSFKLDLGAFDIETIQEDDTTKININTFIDLKSLTAYAIYVRDYAKYPYQDTIQQDVNKFIEETRSKLVEVIENTQLQGLEKDINMVKEKCLNIAKNLTFKIIECASEEELICRSIHYMFEVHHPDILTAFNTPYDLTHFQKRIEELGLPIGLLNIKKYRDVQPKFMEGMNRDTWSMFGDTRSGKKRSCSFDVIRPTHIVDYQMLYYSNRSFNTFSSESLQNTAERELGFGKLDYSQWSNSVVTLPYKNFRIHLSYGLIDSILLLFLNEKLKDVESKIVYTIITKNNIEQSVHSNPSITNWVFASVFNNGYVHGINKNKILKRMTIEDIEKMSKITGVDFIGHRNNLPSKYLSNTDDDEEEPYDESEYIDDDVEFIDRNKKIRGGIVSPPQNLIIDTKDFERFNILGNEVSLSVFLKELCVAYLDFMSHYPYTIISRNLNMQSIKAEISSLISVVDDSIILSKNLHKNNKKYVENFGFLHMAIINSDIVTYSNKACGTPSMTELIETQMNLDSEPNFKVKELFQAEIELHNSHYDKFIQLMVQIDKSKFSDTEINFFNPSNGSFLPENGSIIYYGTRVDYEYQNGHDFISELIFEGSIDKNFKKPNDDLLIFRRLKGKLINCPELLSDRPPMDLPEIAKNGKWTEWRDIPRATIEYISELDFTSEPVNLPMSTFTMFITKKNLYYPMDYFLKQKEVNKEKSRSVVYVSPLTYRYIQRDYTVLIQFRYLIKYKGVELIITQSMNVINFNLDINKYRKEGKCEELV